METVPEVELDWFFEHILPPIPEGLDMTEVMLSLGEIVVGERRTTRKSAARIKSDLFECLGTVFTAAIEGAKKQPQCPEQHFTISPGPDHTFFIPTEAASQNPPSWYSCAVTNTRSGSPETNVTRTNKVRSILLSLNVLTFFAV